MKNKKLWVSIIAGALAVLMLLSLLAGLFPMRASAASSAQIREEINGLKNQQEELQGQIDDLKSQISDNMGEIEIIIAEKHVIDQEIFLLHQQVANVNDQIAAYGLLIADKQDELDAALTHQRELNEKNKARIRAMEEEGSLSYWSVLFEANSFSDLLDRLNMIEEIAAADHRRLEEMRKAADVVEEAQANLETEKKALEATKAELDVMQAELEVKRAEADAILVELNAKGDSIEDMLEEVHDEEEALLAEIAKAEKEYNAAKAREEEEERKRKEEEERKKQEALLQQQQQQQQQQGQQNQTQNQQKPNTSGLWAMPCWYTYLSSPYGYRIHPVHGTWKFHSGVDLAAPSGTPIYASRSGTVTAATYNSSNGYYVSVNHGDGFSSIYLHMTHYVVSAGQKVSAGQVIGYVGSTGISTGPHLHFTIYYNGASQNPADYINFY